MSAAALALLLIPQEPLVTQDGGTEFTLGGDLLGRAEFRDDADFGTPGGQSEDSVRARGLFRLGFRQGPYLGGAAELLGTWGDTGETSTEDLHQLYLDFERALGNWDLRAGRTELDFGDGRLISASRAWLFEPNSFDGLVASGRWPRPIFEWTAWVTEGANGPAGALDDRFSGLHADWRVNERVSAEAFFTLRSQAATELDEMTLAARWHGRTVFGLDWSVFGAMQGGDSFDGREIWAQAAALNVQKELDYGHHVGAEFAVAKGADSDTDDFKRYTPVYIDQHRYNGRADLFAFANLLDLSLNYWRAWNERWSLHADAHQFWRQSVQDDAYAAYTLEPYGITGGSSALGTELDLYAEGDLGGGFRCDFGTALFLNGSALPSDENQLWLFASLAFTF